MVNKINGTGIMLPIKLIIVAWAGDIPSDMPTGIAPLSPIIGNAAVSITVNSMDKKLSSSFKISSIHSFL
jgi:hypothetical protein